MFFKFRHEYFWALQKASPIMAGYFAVSFVFGLTAVNQGLAIWVPVLMSLMVYAGAAQFAFLPLVMAQASMSAIVMSKKQRLWYGFGLTDESFAIHSLMSNDRHLGPYFLTAFNTFCHSAWILSTLIGALVAAIAADMVSVNLDGHDAVCIGFIGQYASKINGGHRVDVFAELV